MTNGSRVVQDFFQQQSIGFVPDMKNGSKMRIGWTIDQKRSWVVSNDTFSRENACNESLCHITTHAIYIYTYIYTDCIYIYITYTNICYIYNIYITIIIL